jgi:hypothetical protein
MVSVMLHTILYGAHTPITQDSIRSIATPMGITQDSIRSIAAPMGVIQDSIRSIAALMGITQDSIRSIAALMGITHVSIRSIAAPMGITQGSIRSIVALIGVIRVPVAGLRSASARSWWQSIRGSAVWGGSVEAGGEGVSTPVRRGPQLCPCGGERRGRRRRGWMRANRGGDLTLTYVVQGVVEPTRATISSRAFAGYCAGLGRSPWGSGWVVIGNLVASLHPS